MRVVDCQPNTPAFEDFSQLPEKLYTTPYRTNAPAEKYLKHCFLFYQENNPVARYALYVNPRLEFEGQSTICVGSYESIDDPEVVEFVGRHIKEQIVVHGKDIAIGPMEGSTLNNYRFSSTASTRNFFMEPFHPLFYNNHFAQMGFHVLDKYHSDVKPIEGCNHQVIAEFEAGLVKDGLRHRSLKLKDFESELDEMIDLVLDGFRENFLYTPINASTFKQKYLSIQSVLQEELMFVIEDEHQQFQAMFFGIHDYYDPKKETVIFKTVVRRRDFKRKGLSKYLDEKFTCIAMQMGYKKIIHAFMHGGNISKKISGNKRSEEYKEYLLYYLKP